VNRQPSHGRFPFKLSNGLSCESSDASRISSRSVDTCAAIRSFDRSIAFVSLFLEESAAFSALKKAWAKTNPAVAAAPIRYHADFVLSLVYHAATSSPPTTALPMWVIIISQYSAFPFVQVSPFVGEKTCLFGITCKTWSPTH
jgi:hypothetical protein